MIADIQNPQICGLTQEQAAKIMNVSVRSVQLAVSVRKYGVPELSDAVTNGSISVSVAAELTYYPHKEQLTFIAGGKRVMRKAAADMKRRRLPSEINPQICGCCGQRIRTRKRT